MRSYVYIGLSLLSIRAEKKRLCVPPPHRGDDGGKNLFSRREQEQSGIACHRWQVIEAVLLQERSWKSPGEWWLGSMRCLFQMANVSAVCQCRYWSTPRQGESKARFTLTFHSTCSRLFLHDHVERWGSGSVIWTYGTNCITPVRLPREVSMVAPYGYGQSLEYFPHPELLGFVRCNQRSRLVRKLFRVPCREF